MPDLLYDQQPCHQLEGVCVCMWTHKYVSVCMCRYMYVYMCMSECVWVGGGLDVRDGLWGSPRPHPHRVSTTQCNRNGQKYAVYLSRMQTAVRYTCKTLLKPA